jgi:hypothetical protein
MQRADAFTVKAHILEEGLSDGHLESTALEEMPYGPRVLGEISACESLASREVVS